jgi:hypothetical protein
MLGAMCAAEDFGCRLDAMANDRAIAVGAAWRHGLYRAFETIEFHASTAIGDAEHVVVVVPTRVTFFHRRSPGVRAAL